MTSVSGTFKKIRRAVTLPMGLLAAALLLASCADALNSYINGFTQGTESNPLTLAIGNDEFDTLRAQSDEYYLFRPTQDGRLIVFFNPLVQGPYWEVSDQGFVGPFLDPPGACATSASGWAECVVTVSAQVQYHLVLTNPLAEILDYALNASYALPGGPYDPRVLETDVALTGTVAPGARDYYRYDAAATGTVTVRLDAFGSSAAPMEGAYWDVSDVSYDIGQLNPPGACATDVTGVSECSFTVIAGSAYYLDLHLSSFDPMDYTLLASFVAVQ